MSRLWNFLDSETAGSGTNEADSPSPAAEHSLGESGGRMSALRDWGVIHARGADAAAFLHSQLSNDIQGMEAADSRFAAYCNAKGRALALLRVLRTDDGFLLMTHKALVDSLIRRLRMFVLRSKVTLEDASETTGVIGLAGSAASAPLQKTTGSVPESPGGVHHGSDNRLMRLSSVPDRFALAAPAEALAELWESLAQDLAVVPNEGWQLLEIRAGIPTVTPGTQEAFVPQMLNLEPLQGISYSKGCYPGQEVIARMHYLGKLKRRMYRLELPTGTPPTPGDTVRAGTGDKEAGTVVTAARATPGSCELLAVLRTELAEQDGLLLNDTRLRTLELPYGFEG